MRRQGGIGGLRRGAFTEGVKEKSCGERQGEHPRGQHEAWKSSGGGSGLLEGGQGRQERLGRGEAVVRIFLEKLLDDLGEGFGDIGPALLDRDWTDVGDPV